MAAAYFKLFLLIGLMYGTLLFLGWGLTKLLLPDSKHGIGYAPWVGIAQTGLILVLLAWTGLKVQQIFYIPLIFSAALALRSALLAIGKMKTRFSSRSTVLISVTLLAGFILALPSVDKNKYITSFTLGNNDILDYTLTAEYLKDHNFKPFVKPFGESPDHSDASVGERIASWQIPSTRWLGIFFLSFLSSLYRVDSSVLFSPFLCLLVALIIPLLSILASDTLKLSGIGLLGLLLAVINPHIPFIAYHAFLPQILSTGFLIGYLTLLGPFARNPARSIKETLFISIWTAALVTAYLELFTFVIILTTLYFIALAVIRQITVAQALAQFGRWLLLSAFLAPYQAFMFFPIIIFHSGWSGGGWDISEKYYLFMTQLGVYKFDPQWIIPFPFLEWIGNIVILALILVGIRFSSEPWLMLAMVAPFILSGFTSYSGNWNYRYFKNLTYVYFWPSLVIGSALMRIKGMKIWNYCAVLFLAGLISMAGMNAVKRLRITMAGALRIPQELTALRRLNNDRELKTIFAPGLDFQESLWVGYFLMDKNLILDFNNPYLRNDVQKPGEIWRGSVLSKIPMHRSPRDAMPLQTGPYYFYAPSRSS